MSSSKVSLGVSLLLALAVGLLVSCRDESAPPRSAGEAAPPPEDTKINRTHSEVKTELQHAAEKTRRAVNGLQQGIQRGAGKGADELGVRRSAAGIPRRAGDAGT
jgi:hypothetical protein